MLVKDLLKVNATLKLIKKGSIDKIESFSFLEDPKDYTVCFLKSKKYLKRVGKRSEHQQFDKVILVIDQDLYAGLENDDLLNLFDSVYSGKNLNKMILELSKDFFKQKFGQLNMLLDGRQIGSADIDPTADIAQNVFIGDNVKIGKNVQIFPGTVISPEVSIGDNSVIFSNVTIYPFTEIGADCRIHGGTVIGADGFGYEFLEGRHEKIWHIGGVKIGKNVEIGSNSNVDMGVMHPTTIGEGTKIDGHVHIGHNCYVGKHCIICGQSGLAGSAVLEDYCIVGGRVAIGPDAYLEQGTQVAGATVVNDGAHFPPKSVIGGYPAKPLKEWMREVAFLRIAAKNKGK